MKTERPGVGETIDLSDDNGITMRTVTVQGYRGREIVCKSTGDETYMVRNAERDDDGWFSQDWS